MSKILNHYKLGIERIEKIKNYPQVFIDFIKKLPSEFTPEIWKGIRNIYPFPLEENEVDVEIRFKKSYGVDISLNRDNILNYSFFESNDGEVFFLEKKENIGCINILIRDMETFVEKYVNKYVFYKKEYVYDRD